MSRKGEKIPQAKIHIGKHSNLLPIIIYISHSSWLNKNTHHCIHILAF